MPTFGPVNRKTLIQCFRRLGFAGPYSGGKQKFWYVGRSRCEFPIRIKAILAKNCWQEFYVKPV